MPEKKTDKPPPDKLPEGFTCECGVFHPFRTYVYAHWSEPLDHTCDRCKRKHIVLRGRVTKA